jgi:hypothetical protein
MISGADGDVAGVIAQLCRATTNLSTKTNTYDGCPDRASDPRRYSLRRDPATPMSVVAPKQHGLMTSRLNDRHQPALFRQKPAAAFNSP